jgi:hypothetical protein
MTEHQINHFEVLVPVVVKDSDVINEAFNLSQTSSKISSSTACAQLGLLVKPIGFCRY